MRFTKNASKKLRSGVALRLVSIEMRKNYVVWSWASERCLRHVYFCLKPPSCSERNERTSTEKFIAFFCVVQLEIHRRVSSRLMNDALLPAWMYFVYICNCFGKLRCFFVRRATNGAFAREKQEIVSGPWSICGTQCWCQRRIHQRLASHRPSADNERKPNMTQIDIERIIISPLLYCAIAYDYWHCASNEASMWMMFQFCLKMKYFLVRCPHRQPSSSSSS